MPEIKVLSDSLINKIQAGEVVERPASVVKELVENSIDAGAGSIRVEITGAGKKLILVSDDGFGMDREDALLSLKRHATSKLINEDNLWEIKTMGFRGEALPSIASVSRLTLKSAPEGPEGLMEGVSIETDAGVIKEVKAAGMARGTLIEVRDLFFNTPARKKFLKKDQTELMHIIEAVTRLAIPNPAISFLLLVDGRELMSLPRASGIRERLMQVYGDEFMAGLIEINAEASGISMNAFVSRKENLREARSHQYIFVNRRPVKEQSVSHAVYSAYDLITRERHPVYFAFLDIDPKKVDCNVHPTKNEVRFSDKEFVYRFVRESIAESMTPPSGGHTAFYASPSGAGAGAPVSFADRPAAGFSVFEAVPLALKTDMPFIYLGETFIALSEGGGLTLIDHHAAHERILYERLLEGVDLGSSQLLFPRQVKLSSKEHMVIMGHRDMLSEFGMEVEDFGHDTVLVRAIPEAMNEADLRGILSDAAAVMAEGSRPVESMRQALAASIACHASIRGRRILNQEELRALLNDLNASEHPDECPHGRPTRVFYSLDELKRIFKRK